MFVVIAAMLSGCAGRHRGARTLGAVGTALVVGGGTAWAVGERRDNEGAVGGGFVALAAGLAAVVAAGGWMAATIACRSDADCDETEACREVPAPPGGVPYAQCTPR